MNRPRVDFLMCAASPAYFVASHVWIYNATDSAWMRFALWPAQVETLGVMGDSSKLVVLKARQLGLSWLSLAYALWLLIFRAPATVLLFSQKEDEAVELLNRLRGMYIRLPTHLRARTLPRDAAKTFELSTGSRALAFSTNGGRSYTGTLAIVDEADFVPDLNSFINAVKPTIDAGGQLFLISTSDKRQPMSTFKSLYRAAVAGVGEYRHIFLPWHARPDRDAAWHDRTRAEMFAQRGTDDDFFAEYPATPEEALAPESLDRRIPYHWIEPVFLPAQPNRTWPHLPPLPGLQSYTAPLPGTRYVIGADPAEGNPNSDDSAATVLNAYTGKEAASLRGKIEPTVFAAYLDTLAAYYNHAGIMIERNNHGHTVIAALQQSAQHKLLSGYDGKPGWLSNLKGKVILYNHTADIIRDQLCTLRTPELAAQLASIEASTLRAPEGLHDDLADSFALAVAGSLDPTLHAKPSRHIAPTDPLAGVDKDSWK